MPRGSWATSTTALGTTATAISGMSVIIPEAGMYLFEMALQVVNVGSPTQTTFTVSPSGGPTTSSLWYYIQRVGASGTATMASVLTAWNTATATTIAGVTSCFVYGQFTATAPGTLSLSGTRTGGTSQTVQIGAYIRVESPDKEWTPWTF